MDKNPKPSPRAQRAGLPRATCSAFTSLGIPVVPLETKLDFLRANIIEGNYESALGHLDDLRDSLILRRCLQGMKLSDLTTDGHKSLRYTEPNGPDEGRPSDLSPRNKMNPIPETSDPTQIGALPPSACSALALEKAWATFNVEMVVGYRKQVDEMATLLRKLVRCVRKSQPDNELAKRAMDYLARHGFNGTTLRNEPNAEVRDAAPAHPQTLPANE